jgi:RNA polymerase sigma-B factor
MVNIVHDSEAATDENARTVRCIRRFREDGDTVARDTVVAQFRPLVEKLSRRYAAAEIPHDDLVQEGFIALLSAIDNFDPSKNVKFITYATHTINGHLRHTLRDKGQIIKEPAWLQELTLRLRRASDELSHQLGREPTTEELAQSVGLSEQALSEIEANRSVFDVSSIEDTYEEEWLNSTDDRRRRIDASSATQPSIEVDIEQRVVLESALDKLKEIEQRVIYLFYYEDNSQADIARRLNISNNYVSHVLKNSARKLQQIFRNEALRDAALQYERRRSRQQVADTGDVAEPRQLSSDVVDKVTGVYSRAYFLSRLDEEVSRAQRHNIEVSLIRIGLLDDLPEASLFVAFAHAIRDSLRRADLVGRTDSREISALLPHTGASTSVVVIRLTRELSDLFDTFRRPVQFAIGSATYPICKNAKMLIDAAAPQIV